MRILKLRIDGYKMFTPNIDLKLGKELLLFVGVNGSGKSTILEALALIFSEVKQYCETPKSYERTFNFSIEYTFNDTEILDQTSTTSEIITTVNHIQLSSSKESGLDYTMYVNKILVEKPKDMLYFLPDNLIFYYAGFCDTLSNIVHESEQRQAEKLFSLRNEYKITEVISGMSKNLTYIDKNHYPLLFLLNYIDREGILPLCKKKFSITNIRFWLKRPENFKGDAKNLFNLSGFLRRYLDNLISFNYTEGVELNEEGEPYFDLDFHLGFFEALRELPELSDKQRFEMDRFYTFHFVSLLFTIGILERIDVVISDDKVHKYKINELSEGEQQLITLSAIKSVFSLANTVILLDEPDAFLHPQRQREIIPHLKEIFSQNVPQLIVTTHSPFVAQSFKSEEIILFNGNGKVKNVFDHTLDIKAISKELFGVGERFNMEIEELLDNFVSFRNQIMLNRPINKTQFKSLVSRISKYGEETSIIINRELAQLKSLKDFEL